MIFGGKTSYSIVNRGMQYPMLESSAFSDVGARILVVLHMLQGRLRATLPCEFHEKMMQQLVHILLFIKTLVIIT